MAVNIITQFVLKQFAKKSARKTGIAKLLKASDPVVQSNARNIEIILKDMGINTKNLKSTDDVLKAMNYRNAMMNQHIKQQFKGLDLDKGIKSLEKKKTPIVKDPTKEIIDWDRDPFRGFSPRVQQDVDSIIKDLKNMKPMAAMKEANLIIGRKGKYKNLSGDESQRILKETDDHIFERDIKYDEFGEPIKPDPEDFASGGRVPLMYGGDPGFQFEYGGSWADWHDQHRDTMPIEQYIQTKLPKERLPFREMQTGGLAYMLGEPTYMKYSVGGSVGHAPWHKPTGQAQPTPHMDTPPPQVAGTPDPMKAPRGLPSVAPKNMDPAYMQQKMMQQAMMGRGPGTPGQGPRPMANAGGRIGYENAGDVEIPDTENILKKLKDFIEKRKKYDDAIMRAERIDAAEGGRMGYAAGSMGRRTFMKILAGIASLPFIGKGVAKKAAAPVVKETAEAIATSNAVGMPAWFPSLVNKVIKEGDDVGKAAGAMERQTVHRATLPSGTPVEVTSDLTSGDVIVDIGMGKHGWSSGFHGQPTRLVLKKGEWIEPTKKGKKGIKTKDEFMVEEAEFTGGHPENIKFEEVTVEKYGQHGSDFTEVEKYATGKTTKGSKAQKEVWEADWDDVVDPSDESGFGKASGGLAGLLGE